HRAVVPGRRRGLDTGIVIMVAVVPAVGMCSSNVDQRLAPFLLAEKLLAAMFAAEVKGLAVALGAEGSRLADGDAAIGVDGRVATGRLVLRRGHDGSRDKWGHLNHIRGGEMGEPRGEWTHLVGRAIMVTLQQRPYTT